MSSKRRLDLVLQEQLPHLSRNKVASFIMLGRVTVNGRVQTKAGTQVSADDEVVCDINEPRFVSRAGEKLEQALTTFGVNPAGFVVLDAGISTGGFTDCLLQHGAARVYGVDVGYGQVHEKIRQDARVILMERTNLRNLERLPDLVDLVTLDLSFISVLKVLPAVIKLMKPEAQMIVLVKPQFEAGRADVGPGGIVKDPAVHQKVLDAVKHGVESFGFTCAGVIDSPILGTQGNKEFLAHFVRKPRDKYL